MHVGSLELFTPPEDAGPDYVKSMHETLLKHTDVDPTFRKKPAAPSAVSGTCGGPTSRTSTSNTTCVIRPSRPRTASGNC